MGHVEGPFPATESQLCQKRVSEVPFGATPPLACGSMAMAPFTVAAALGHMSIWNWLILPQEWLRKMDRELVVTWAKIKSKAWILASIRMLSGLWDTTRGKTWPICKIPLGTSLERGNNLDMRGLEVSFPFYTFSFFKNLFILYTVFCLLECL